MTRDEREELKLKRCQSCEVANPRRTTRKSTTRVVLHAFDEVHIDVVLYRKKGIEGEQYVTLFTDKASSFRWVYLHKLKGGAYDAVLKYQKYI